MGRRRSLVVDRIMTDPNNRGRLFRRYYGTGLAIGLGVVFALVRWSPESDSVERRVAPAQVRISQAEFGDIIDRLSEPEGYFDTDNFITNETSYQHVIGKLTQDVDRGGVYFGVGPDQNFTYIAHQQPSLAIITDIRRQNMLLHLLFKVLMEESVDRYDFLSLLFSRPRQASWESDQTLRSTLELVRSIPPDEVLLQTNIAMVEQTLLEKYELNLTDEDLEQIRYVYQTFFDESLSLRFSTLGRPSSRYPTLGQLILETDLDGEHQSYLSSEELFLRVKRFQEENRLIPIVGDFAGPAALRAAAGFLKEKGLSVSVFYASNVEFYLFNRSGWQDYVDNVRSFPVRDDAVFIRSYFPTFGRPHPLNVRGHRSTSLIQPIRGFLDDADAGRHISYWDVVGRNN